MSSRRTSAPRRALILEPAGNLWGSERSLLDFVASLSEYGWNAEVCCPPHSPILQELDRRRVPVHPVFTPMLHRKGRLKRAMAAARFAGVTTRVRPHVIHV